MDTPLAVEKVKVCTWKQLQGDDQTMESPTETPSVIRGGLRSLEKNGGGFLHITPYLYFFFKNTN